MKLTKLEKSKVIACVGKVAKDFEIEAMRLEVAYAKLNQYDATYDGAINYNKEQAEFYSNLAKKLEGAI